MTITSNFNFDITAIGFSGGERHVQINNINEFFKLPKQQQVKLSVRADLRSMNDVFDLLLFNDALEQHNNAPVKYTLEIPYLPYARQDRVCATGQAMSVGLMAQILRILNLKSLTIWDCHSPIGLNHTQANNIAPEKIIASSEKLVTLINKEDSLLICPDKGAIKRSEAIQAFFNKDTLIYCEKIRNPNTGDIEETQVHADSLQGKTCIIIDDICDGGYTFIKIAEKLKEKGAEKVMLYVTHGIFSKGISVFDGLIDEIYTSNSFNHEENSKLNAIVFTTKGERI